MKKNLGQLTPSGNACSAPVDTNIIHNNCLNTTVNMHILFCVLNANIANSEKRLFSVIYFLERLPSSFVLTTNYNFKVLSSYIFFICSFLLKSDTYRCWYVLLWSERNLEVSLLVSRF
jgi:hypothetical protein